MMHYDPKMLELISIYEESGFVLSENSFLICLKKTIAGHFDIVKTNVHISKDYSCEAHFETNIGSGFSYKDYIICSKEDTKKPDVIQAKVESVFQLIKLFSLRGLNIFACRSYSCGLEFTNKNKEVRIDFFISPNHFILNFDGRGSSIEMQKFSNENCETLFDAMLQELLGEQTKTFNV